jgi:predicted enzyme related to lactoylglutathione lyase
MVVGDMGTVLPRPGPPRTAGAVTRRSSTGATTAGNIRSRVPASVPGPLKEQPIVQMTSYDHGVPSYIDIGVPDIAAAADFYGRLFGWEAPEGTEETGFYRNATLKGRSVAGIGPQQNLDMPPYWTTYIATDSADDTAAKVAAAGGMTLLPPMDVMDFGRMAIFADPSGAAFGVWQAGTHPGCELVNEPGTLSWNELVSTDIDAAKAFYAAVFGWGEDTHTDGPFPYTEFKVGGRAIAGGMPKGPMLPPEMPSHWSVYFAVADLDAAVGSVKDLGGQVVMPRMDSPAGAFAVVIDPQGAAFNVIQLNPDR